jgi:tRNA1Val (adenine37-N6)-methyltransferase
MTSFQFKQFSITQNTTAMKVGTDGVLLGAWCSCREGELLDIGTGTGLIAIMIAQRAKATLIDAVEIEATAYQQTLENISNCSWSDRISAYHSSIQEFCPNLSADKAGKKYDGIISNPPFFVDATKAPNSERNTARHTDDLSFTDLIDAVVRLLNPDGIFSLILPITESIEFIQLAKEQKLFINRKCIVKPNPAKPAKRVLMEFSFHKKEIIKEELTIETETRHQYTKEYISLTQDFYLNF